MDSHSEVRGVKPGPPILILPNRGGLSLRRSGERLRAELLAPACPATVAISGKNVPDGASGTGPGRVAGRYSVAFVAVNAEQAEDWNGASGRHFIEQRERWERMRGRLTARLLAGAQIQDGENVLDIGCGCGDTTILAARATPRGHALGADLSRIQVAEARRLAACAGVTNARFEVADVQVHAFQAGIFDVVLSSFGVMFFDDPAAAFGNLRKALRRGGRLAFLCWRTRDENPFFTFGFAEAAAVLGLREVPGPDAAFSLADTGRVGALLSGAGSAAPSSRRRTSRCSSAAT